MIRLLICDDHPVVRAGLAAVLGSAGDVEVVGQAADAAAAVAAAPGCDVVTMDLNLESGRDGVAATRAIRALPDPPAVLVLTSYDTDSRILAAVEAGATGYLLKDSEPAELLEAVRRAARGETVLEPRILAKLTHEVQRPRIELTEREREVLEMLSTGRRNAEIAEALFVSLATVKTHLAAIYRKLDVTGRTAAVATARERGLID